VRYLACLLDLAKGTIRENLKSMRVSLKKRPAKRLINKLGVVAEDR
jgi:hypothetical protein